MKVKQIISHWEQLKLLIERENIYADFEISAIDSYFNEELKKEIKPKNGKPST